jgi:hypothetical protein
MSTNRFGDWETNGLASIVTSYEMPDTRTSDRTHAAMMTGALRMMEHLIADDYDPDGHEAMSEFIGRMMANAERQGITVDHRTSPT